jgi:serine/threonine protein phosphatase PrpC
MTMAVSLRFEQGVRSDVGCVRQVNEDSWAARPRDGLWLVADGMGGHAHGQWASSTIAATLEAAPLPEDFEDAATVVRSALQAANAELYAATAARGATIGSTVALLLARDARAAVMWVGDSRVYRLRGGALARRTADHSQVEQLVSRGLLTREEAEHHPMAHVLSRAVGVQPRLVIDVRGETILPGDVFLLCSDGLTRMASEEEIGRVLATEPPRRAADALIALALARGAPDNVTAVVVGCDSTTLVNY